MKTRALIRLLLTVSICLIPAFPGHTADIFKEIAAEFSDIPSLQKKGTVAVFPFETMGTPDVKFGAYVSEKIVHELVALGTCTVVERTKITRVMSEQELSMSGALTSDTLDKIGRLLSVDVLILGTVNLSKGHMEILARAIDIRTGSVLKSVSRNIALSSIPEKELPVFRDKAVKEPAPIKGTVGEEDLRCRFHSVQVFRSAPQSYYFIGLIENTGPREINKPAITISLLDKKKEQLGVAQAFAQRNVLPGETLPFRGFLKDGPAAYHTFEVVYEPQEKLFTTYISTLTSSQTRLASRRLGTLVTYTLTGYITNPNDYLVSYPQVIVSFYDKKGNFIGSGNGYGAVKKLGPGKRAPFTITVYSSSLNGKPSHYRLHYSGLWSR